MKKLILLMSLLLVFSLAACNANATNDKTDQATKEHTFSIHGQSYTVQVPNQPERIVVIGYDVIDIVDSLGHKDKIVGVPDPKNPMFPSFLEGYENITSVGSLGGDDLEAIAGLQPDLIIIGSRATGAYEDLSEIAPTVALTIPGMFGTSFTQGVYDNIEEVAFLLNDQAAGKKAVADLKDHIEAMGDKVGALEDPSAMVLILTGKAMNVYTDHEQSRYGFVYNEFGFKSAASTEEVAVEDKKVNNGEASRHGNSISFEFIAAKNPNYLLVIDRGVITGQSTDSASDTLDNDLINNTNAGKNDHIIYVDGTSWYLSTGGIESTKMMLKNLEEGLNK